MNWLSRLEEYEALDKKGKKKYLERNAYVILGMAISELKKYRDTTSEGITESTKLETDSLLHLIKQIKGAKVYE